MRLNAVKSSAGRSKPLSAERIVNLYPEEAPPDARSPVVLLGAPGLSSFATVGAGPIRKMIVMNSVLYVVSGNGFYSVSSAGTATLLGTIPNASGNISAAHNGVQIVVSDGSNDYMNGYFIFAGATWGYTYSVADGFDQITDPDFPPSTDSAAFFISSAFDGQVYDASEYASADSYPDPLSKVFRDHQELILFGGESGEVWQDAGLPDFPFAAITGAAIEKGLGAFNSVQKLDNSVVWLDHTGIVRRAEAGWTPVRISTHAVEYKINQAKIAGTMGSCTSWSYSEEGHEFYVLNIPGNGTWCFDAATKMWHERKSYGLTRFRGECYVNCYDKHIVGDYATGKLWEMSLNTYTEGDDSLIAELVFPTVYNEGKRFVVDRFEIVGEHGVGLATGQGSDPQYMLDVSADGGVTYGSEVWREMGEMGDYQARPEWRKLGQFRQFTPRVRISDPVKRAIYMAHIDLRLCTS